MPTFLQSRAPTPSPVASGRLSPASLFGHPHSHPLHRVHASQDPTPVPGGLMATPPDSRQNTDVSLAEPGWPDPTGTSPSAGLMEGPGPGPPWGGAACRFLGKQSLHLCLRGHARKLPLILPRTWGELSPLPPPALEERARRGSDDFFTRS